MTNLEAGDGCDRFSQDEIRLEIKETRQGKILTYADNAAPSGLRGMTETEIQVHGHITDLISRFNTESVEPGYVGSMYFDDSGQPDIEWNTEEARAAAENSI